MAPPGPPGLIPFFRPAALRPARHRSGVGPHRTLWRRLRRLCTIPATDHGVDADAGRWADWLTSTRVLEDGLNPSTHRPSRTALDPIISAHDTPGVTA